MCSFLYAIGCSDCLNQAINDEEGEMNIAVDPDTKASGTIPAIAKQFKARNQPWALIVDENYGEGSAREHAALQPRFYGQSESNAFPLADGLKAAP